MSAISKGIVAMVAAIAGWGAIAPSVHAQSWDDRSQTVYCASTDSRFVRCRTPWPESQLVKQVSDTRCVYGQTWGNDRGSVWVDRGCRANFGPSRGGWGGGRPPGWNDGGYPYPGQGPGWGGGPGGGRPFEVRCDSNGSRYQVCPVDLGRGASVRLVRRLSDSRCVEGYSWGTDRRGIWVDQGCRAIFQVDRRW